MRTRRVISATLTLCLFLAAYVIAASSRSPATDKTSGEFTVLQLDKPLRFLNSDGLPLNIPAGTFQVTAPSPDTLQLTSPSTGEVQNLHATAMTHTESLTVPYPFLIEEAGEQGHVHLLLLLPDGQGLDAEGRWEHIQSRGIGDMTRFAFTPTRQYSGVVMQQGRVTTDADLNEQEAVSSSTSSLHSNVAPSYGRVTLEQGRIKLDLDARQSLLRRCRFCARKQ